jgi:choline-sulfatase
MTPQNLLIRMSDQHKARMMGCAGHPLAKISNLDAPAVRGTRCVDA